MCHGTSPAKQVRHKSIVSTSSSDDRITESFVDEKTIVGEDFTSPTKTSTVSDPAEQNSAHISKKFDLDLSKKVVLPQSPSAESFRRVRIPLRKSFRRVFR